MLDGMMAAGENRKALPLKKQGFAPKLLITDKLRSYSTAAGDAVLQHQQELLTPFFSLS
jgi:hypothetical protein